MRLDFRNPDLEPKLRNDGKTRKSKSVRLADPVLLAPLLDVVELSLQLLAREAGHVRVGFGVVTDLKAHLVQFHDLLPDHVVPLATVETEPLSHVESGSETVLLQDIGHKVPVRLVAVIKTEHDQLVRNGFKSPGKRTEK